MHNTHRMAIGLVLIVLMAGLAVTAAAAPKPNPVADRWERVSGDPAAGPAGIDGIMNDRENSYAWSMETFDGSLWVGTNRDVFGTMFTMARIPITSWPAQVPPMTDLRPRIYRMNLSTGAWQQYFVPADLTGGAGPVRMGIDNGYRMMRTYTPPGGEPALYVGSLGTTASLLAIDGEGSAPARVFSVTASGMRYPSVRAIAEHDGALYWATDDSARPGRPAIYYSTDPLGQFRADPGVTFARLAVPDTCLPAAGAEILDMISYNGALYVFFLPYTAEEGFWCAKVATGGAAPAWTLVVGDTARGARYPAGMGRAENGGAVPVVFKDRVYVGTMDGAAFRLMNGISTPVYADVTMGGANGMQIYRFDGADRWERVMPKGSVRDAAAVLALNGFANPYNKYMWRFGVQGNRLYVGTFDIGTGTQVLAPAMGMAAPASPTPLGFDLYWTTGGDDWQPVTVSGFGNAWNYGARSFASDPATGDLYLGTANPFYGCQVWRLRSLQGGT